MRRETYEYCECISIECNVVVNSKLVSRKLPLVPIFNHRFL